MNPKDEKRWRCEDCTFITDNSDTATLHMANNGHAVVFVTAEVLALLLKGRQRLKRSSIRP